MNAVVTKLFEHMFWADQRVLRLLEDSETRTAEALRLASHVISAERIWLARVRGEATSRPVVWPDWTWEELFEAAQESRESWAAFLEELDPSALERPVSYRAGNGALFETSVIDILTHVALHGSYHRGQIANAVRRSGAEPVNTDFMVYVRSVQRSAD